MLKVDFYEKDMSDNLEKELVFFESKTNKELKSFKDVSTRDLIIEAIIALLFGLASFLIYYFGVVLN